MTQAPPAIVKLTETYKARPDRARSYVMDGIVGDAAHMNPPEGYHVSPRDEGFRWGAYSLDTARDRAGGKKYPDYASAWDLGLNRGDMILLTARLIAAAVTKDPRLHSVAEIAGTTNGHTVHAFYVNTGKDDPNNTGGWASSHTKHIHLSISRDDCDNYDALLPILDVLCGVPLHPIPPTPASPKEVEMILVTVDPKTLPKGVTASPGTFSWDGSSLVHVEPAEEGINNVHAFTDSGVPAAKPITYKQYQTMLAASSK